MCRRRGLVLHGNANAGVKQLDDYFNNTCKI
uniref:Uncharacterized protein n=1 Tax=Setaria viridis TaxID=4556 RepID=A0A4U6THW8_SETVI|nr:hypothetical protein SEVIR_8G108050v2 [Setaria viridis]